MEPDRVPKASANRYPTLARWWDGQEKDKGGRGKVVSDLKQVSPGKNGLPDRLTLHRWRRRLKADADFAAVVRETASARWEAAVPSCLGGR